MPIIIFTTCHIRLSLFLYIYFYREKNMFMLTSLHTKACRKNVTWFSKTKNMWNAYVASTFLRSVVTFFLLFPCTAKVQGRSVSHIFIVINNIITIQHVCVVLFACSMLNKPCLQKKKKTFKKILQLITAQNMMSYELNERSSILTFTL